MVFVPHHLAYFTQHNALQFHPCSHKHGQELLLSLCCIEFHCVNVPQFFDQLIYLWAHRLLPVFGYCKLCCYENCGAYVLLNWCFRILRVYSQQWNCWVKRKFHFQFSEESPYCFPQWPHQSAFPPTVHQGSLFFTSSPTLVC